MALLTWLAVAASGLVFGQMQNFGTDPDEKKRGERMISQGEKVVAQNEKIVKQQWIAIGIAIVALIISLFALFRH